MVSGTARRQTRRAITANTTNCATAAIAEIGSSSENRRPASASASTVNSSGGMSTKNASLDSTALEPSGSSPIRATR